MKKQLLNSSQSILLTRVLSATLYLSGALFLGVPVWANEEHGHHGGHHEKMQAGQAMEESSFGKPGMAGKVSRTIEVSMGDDMRFKPDNFMIQRDETIRFIVKNTGSTDHEMVIGTADEIREHAEMMKKMPGMQHNDANMIRVKSGQSGEIIWNFDLAGTFKFACLIPGHMEAGMTGTIQVVESK